MTHSSSCVLQKLEEFLFCLEDVSPEVSAVFTGIWVIKVHSEIKLIIYISVGPSHNVIIWLQDVTLEVAWASFMAHLHPLFYSPL